jgi:hypothetical protein
MSIDVKQELIDLIADMAVAIEASKIEDAESLVQRADIALETLKQDLEYYDIVQFHPDDLQQTSLNNITLLRYNTPEVMDNIAEKLSEMMSGDVYFDSLEVAANCIYGKAMREPLPRNMIADNWKDFYRIIMNMYDEQITVSIQEECAFNVLKKTVVEINNGRVVDVVIYNKECFKSWKRLDDNYADDLKISIQNKINEDIYNKSEEKELDDLDVLADRKNDNNKDLK